MKSHAVLTSDNVLSNASAHLPHPYANLWMKVSITTVDAAEKNKNIVRSRYGLNNSFFDINFYLYNINKHLVYFPLTRHAHRVHVCFEYSHVSFISKASHNDVRIRKHLFIAG